MSNHTVPLLAVLLTMSLVLPVLGADAWSPESGGASWERISRLQSVASASAMDPQLAIDCCRSEEVVERLAAISWIARTQSVRHIAELQRLLSDSVREVRELAFEALLAMPHPDAAAAVLKAIDTMPDLTASSLGNICYRRDTAKFVSGQDAYLLEMLSALLPDERRDWSAHLLDEKEWSEQYARERTGASRYQVWLDTSVLQRDGFLTLVFKTAGKEESRSEPSDVLELKRVSDSQRAKDPLSDVLYGRAKLQRTRAAGQRWLYEFVADPTPVAPGIYAVSINAPPVARTFGVECFPFFIRVNRSLQDEREIPQLLKRLPDQEAATRLGLLRVREAARQLIEQFRSMPSGCEQSQIAAALAMIGDGRAAEAFLDQPWLRCQDSGYDVGALLSALDAAAEPFYAKRIESADDLFRNWAKLDNSERRHRLLPIELSLAYCQRPLPNEQAQRVEKLLEHIAESAAAKPWSSDDLEFIAADLLITYSIGDRNTILRWLAKFQKAPSLYLTTLRALFACATNRTYGIRISDETLQAIQDQVHAWLEQPSRTPELRDRFADGLKHRGRVQSPLYVAGKPAGPVKQRFGHKYFFDGRRQFWSEADGKPQRWGAFLRDIKKWLLFDAETLCVETADHSLQIVRPNESVRSWSSSELWGRFDARSKDWLFPLHELGRVGDSLVVPTSGCLVFVLPIRQDVQPWIVDEPAEGGTPQRPLFDPDPFAEEAPEFPPRPRTLNDRVRSAAPRVWKLGSQILIAADVHEKTFALQCVDVPHQKILWEEVVTEPDLQQRIRSEGWKPLED